ncbi:hypothetical protein PVAND_002823 [Polypedilum vanderplanki]|uniref:Sas10 C-terminal domain-containing protein n=1 Tax=Polypedilum vanderplanki TaxID=319348 RepID=A0A9J6BSK0_POLVA|nr:hypothetical protein PVAND_002823 [Polypedilum vanderplanki]
MEDKMNLNHSDYEVSESEDEYTPRERKLLQKVKERNRNRNEENDEVLKFDESDISDELEKFEADSDFEERGDNEDYLPDSRAWGKKKQNFYNTDFHDNDYSTYTEKEEEIANLEQQEALEIQKRLASELNESDFNLDMFNITTSAENASQQNEIKVKKTTTDLSDLSKKQKLALLRAEAPEFEGLVQDFNERMTEAKDLLIPVMKIINPCEELPKHPFVDFIKCRLKLILDYCTNISFYLMLKAKRTKVKNHPIVKRLVQFRQLINQLDDIFEYVIQPQITVLLSQANEKSSPDSFKEKLLNILKPKANIDGEQSDEESEEEKPLFSANQDDNDEDINEQSLEQMDIEEEEKDAGKRKITRQIAKNKGLTVSKRRELRNPRVKNKLKFTKAVKRRKGAVQPIRSKAEVYGGEKTGIKTHVKRSVKIK